MTYYTIPFKSDGTCCEDCQPDPTTCSCEEGEGCCDIMTEYVGATLTYSVSTDCWCNTKYDMTFVGTENGYFPGLGMMFTGTLTSVNWVTMSGSYPFNCTSSTNWFNIDTSTKDCSVYVFCVDTYAPTYPAWYRIFTGYPPDTCGYASPAAPISGCTGAFSPCYQDDPMSGYSYKYKCTFNVNTMECFEGDIYHEYCRESYYGNNCETFDGYSGVWYSARYIWSIA